MRRAPVPWVPLLLVAGLTSCGGAPEQESAAPELPDGYDRERIAADLSASLEAAGFEVDRGEVVFFQVEDCEGLPSCYGNNPSSPYGLFRVPPAPGEAPAPSPGPLSSDAGNTTFRLREDEALLFLGPTPPRARYFSFASYVARRGDTAVFGSVGDPANQLSIATSGPGADPFDRETAVLFTADRALAEDLRGRLGDLGLGALVNDQPFPADLARLGLGAESDLLTVLFRVALFEDPAEGDAYMASPGAVLLRVRPAEPRAITASTFQGYRPRGAGTNEEALSAGVDRLGAAIEQRFAGSSVKQDKLVQLGLAGDKCIHAVTECNGDNPDTLYWAVVPRALPPGDRIVLYGVDHRAAGKATYTNAAVYDYLSLRGSVASHDGEFGGSAAFYLGESDPDAPSLFAWTFARACEGQPFCTEVPEAFPGVALPDPMTVVVRAYLEEVTATAPDPAEVLPPRVVFVGPSQVR